MANYYQIIINSPKMTQDVMLDIVQYITPRNRIRSLTFCEGGFLNLYIRGYSNLCSLLQKHGFDETDTTEVADEFSLYNTKSNPPRRREYPTQTWTIWEFEKEPEDGKTLAHQG